MRPLADLTADVGAHHPVLFGAVPTAVLVPMLAAGGVALGSGSAGPAAARPGMGCPDAPPDPGAAIFGAGFALTGSRPGRAVAMVATGGLGGLLVLAGLIAGLWLRGVTERPGPGQHAETAATPEQPPARDPRITEKMRASRM